MNVRYRIIVDNIMFKCDLILRRATDKSDCLDCSDTGSVRTVFRNCVRLQYFGTNRADYCKHRNEPSDST